MKVNLNAILLLLFSFYTLHLPANSLPESPAEQSKKYENPKHRFTIGAGYAYRLGKIYKTGDSKTDDFTKGLRSGFNIDMEIVKYKWKHFGSGFNLNYINQNNKKQNLKESVNFLYIAPCFGSRLVNRRFGLYINFGLGLVWYHDAATNNGMRTEQNDVALGFNLAISGERRINNNIGAGLKFSAIASKGEREVISQEKNNLSNFLITAFICFRPQ